YILRPWGTEGKHAVVRVTPAERASSKMYSIIKALGGQNDLEPLGLGGVFSYPKPVELVKALVTSQTFFDPEAIVLDFFAGSGTTAQAVMEANERDGGSRSFVLVQTPEPLRSKNARAVVAEQGGSARAVVAKRGGSARAHGGRAEEGASAGAHGGRAEDTEFPAISDLTAERIRRAADVHSPGLRFTRLDVVEDE